MSAAEKARNDSARTLPKALRFKLSAVAENSSGASRIVTTSYRPCDPVRDLSEISRVAVSPSILLVRSGLGARTLSELIALAKQKPGEISFGSGGPGSSAHLAMELLLDAAGIRGLHVPFRGAAAVITEVIAGHVDMVIASLAAGVRSNSGGASLRAPKSASRRDVALRAPPHGRGSPPRARRRRHPSAHSSDHIAAASHRSAEPRANVEFGVSL